MSQRAESSGTSRPFLRQEEGQSSHRGNGVPYPLGKETGLPLVDCPDCHQARVLELRVVQETPNKGKAFFKCPHNGTPKLCGFYCFQKEYLDELLRLNVVVIKNQQVDLEAGGSEEEGGVQDEREELEKKLSKLSWKINVMLVVLCIVVIVMVVWSIVRA